MGPSSRETGVYGGRGFDSLTDHAVSQPTERALMDNDKLAKKVERILLVGIALVILSVVAAAILGVAALADLVL